MHPTNRIHVLLALTTALALAISQSTSAVASDSAVDKFAAAIASSIPAPVKSSYDAIRSRVSDTLFGNEWRPATLEESADLHRPKLRLSAQQKHPLPIALAMTSGPDLQCELTNDYIKDGKCQVELVKMIEAMRQTNTTKAEQLAGKPVQFKGSKFIDAGREITFVQVNGQDLSEQLIESGLAFYCPGRHSQIGVKAEAALRYAQAQSRALAGRKGLWSTSAKAPADCTEARHVTRLASN